jgi:hypothetical protein
MGEVREEETVKVQEFVDIDTNPWLWDELDAGQWNS